MAALRPALPFPASRMNTGQHVDVGADKRRKSGDIRLPNLVSLQAQLVEGNLHVDCVPQDDHVNDESRGTELILLLSALVPLNLSRVPKLDCRRSKGKVPIHKRTN
jgi:hypothetical protein